MNIPFYILDAFIDPEKPFSGNQAAVIVLSSDSDLDDDTKQNIAAEFNYAASVFVSRVTAKPDKFMIRWFTPTDEIELCGHCSLAASYVLFHLRHQFSQSISPDKPLGFVTKLGSNLQATTDDQYVTLNFPLNIPEPLNITQHKWLAELQAALLSNEHSCDWFVDAQLGPNRMALLRLRDDVHIGAVSPDYNKLLRIDLCDSFNVLLVTKKADFDTENIHFVSRIFAPWVGVDEDPVCGSALTVLVPYWSKVYREQYNECVDILYAKQASQRTGLIKTQLVQHRLLLSGKVKVFADGILNV